MFNKSFKKLVVTGGAGFIGSEFVRQALASGYQLTVLDKLTYAGDLARLGTLKRRIVFHKVDIKDPAKVMTILTHERPQAIVHFAAESHVDRSIANALEFIQSNVEGTQNLLTVSHKIGIKKFIHISTDEVYGEISSGKFNEHSPLSPNSPYSASKAAGDLLVKAYMRTFDFPAVILRPCNNYGPWQYPEKFIPVIIYKALTKNKIPVYAKGLNVREWLHISDCARAVLMALGSGKIKEVYNVGSGSESTNIDLVHRILDILGSSKDLISYVKDRPGHDLRYALNFNKIKHDLSWKPLIRFDEGIAQTVHWYKDNFRWLESKINHEHK